MYTELNNLLEQNEYSKVLLKIENNPNQLEKRDETLFQAKSFYGLEFFTKAQEILINYLKDEHNDEALLLLTKIYLKDCLIEKAQETFDKIEKENVDYENYCLVYSEIQNQKGLHEEALQSIFPLLEQSSIKYEVKKQKIEILINKKEDLKTLLSEIKELKKLKRDEYINYLIIKSYYVHEDLENTNKQLQKLMRKNPNSKYILKINEMMFEQPKVRLKLTSNDSSVTEPIVHVSEKDLSLQEALAKLDNFIGLEGVKKEIKKIVSVVQIELERKKKLKFEGKYTDSYHFMFYGNPGTGKTTVARILGDIFHALGILEKPDVVEVDRADLVGEHIGETAVKTKKVIDKAMGGVLFIDEAYALAKSESSSNDFGAEAIDTLLKAMEDNRDKFIVIMAGYEDKMTTLLQVNEGLESRINKKIHFNDYQDDELLEIARIFAENKYYKLTEDAEKAFLMKIASEQVKSNFSNARAVRNLIDEATQNRAVRLINTNYSDEQLKILEPIDFEIDINQMFKDDLDDLLLELDALVGLTSIKREIRRLINNIKANQKREAAGMKIQTQAYHMVFTGNPGTGKTMVAKYIGKLFKSLGILKRGQLIQVSREDLVAQYIGHTAPKTKKKIQEAYGGILFIDEAYSLNSGGENDFGKEAVDVLIQEMENNRDRLVVIMAGYTEDMRRLFDLNKGIESRVVYNFEFTDYTSEEITHILINAATKDGFTFEDGCNDLIERKIHKSIINNSESSGNGRLARKMYEELIRIQGDRLIDDMNADPLMFIKEDILKIKN